ncbi:hypothetical protein JZ751_006146 [Albula glossodonta]|uniref:Uncharacterized protein n=1 Tax=Albula glossodonta TaxID=121402 RepID=A0A8T2N514_9TELE|nr:hypothetical protein JZ751_006146 [Albula glossodonta]
MRFLAEPQEDGVAEGTGGGGPPWPRGRGAGRFGKGGGGGALMPSSLQAELHSAATGLSSNEPIHPWAGARRSMTQPDTSSFIPDASSGNRRARSPGFTSAHAHGSKTKMETGRKDESEGGRRLAGYAAEAGGSPRVEFGNGSAKTSGKGMWLHPRRWNEWRTPKKKMPR